MLKIKEVHEHLILHLDHAWEESVVKALVVFLFAIDKLSNLECRLTIIVCLYELLVSDEQTHNSIEESISNLFYRITRQIIFCIFGLPVCT